MSENNNDKKKNNDSDFGLQFHKAMKAFSARLKNDKTYAITLGVGVVIVLILVIVLIMVSCGKDDDNVTTDGNDVIGVQDGVSDNNAQDEDAAPEQAEEPEKTPREKVNELIDRYFVALEIGDTETLKEIKGSTDEKKLLMNEKKSNYTESYNNVEVYTKDGPAENTFVSFVRYDTKFKDIDTPAPGLVTLYIAEGDDGAFRIYDGELEKDIKDYVYQVAAEEDIADIFRQVDTKYAEATDSDPALAKFMDELADLLEKEVKQALKDKGIEDSEDAEEEEPEEEPEEAAPQKTETVVATDTVNVRSSDSENADRLGKLEIGTEVTRYEKKENGWSKIDYNGQEAYVKSEFVKVKEGGGDPTPAETTEVQEESANEQDTGNGEKVTIKETVTVRKSTSETAEKLGTAYIGEHYELLMRQADGWTKIKFNGQVGYVKSDYVK